MRRWHVRRQAVLKRKKPVEDWLFRMIPTDLLVGARGFEAPTVANPKTSINPTMKNLSA